MAVARHDIAIAFNGDVAGIGDGHANQVGDRRAIGHLSWFAIEENTHDSQGVEGRDQLFIAELQFARLAAANLQQGAALGRAGRG